MAAFNYLIAEKNRQTKIADIQYSSLEMQEYMMDGDMVIDVTKFILRQDQRPWTLKLNENGNMKTIPVLVAKQDRKLARKFYLVGILGKRRVKHLCTMICFMVVL